MFGLVLATVLAAEPAPAEKTISIPGPQGALEGTLRTAGAGTPVVLIIPGSGPTDRDGNNGLGKGGSYRMLAEALAERGVSTLRVDKRGLFGSRAALANPNAVTIADYASDVHSWAAAASEKTGSLCVWVVGHSEGGLVALTAAQDIKDLCGVITVSAGGRPMGSVMRDQLKSSPANGSILQPALAAIDTLEEGGSVDAANLPAPLRPLFNPAVQPFYRDVFARDPARLAASLTLPLLIVQGDNDLQVDVAADAEALHKAQPKSTLRVIKGMNHVLKSVPEGDRAANVASYGDPNKPITPEVADAIASFVKAKRR
jgi:pimeloyl-ACP methyl ester carboxylesterase